MVSVLERIEMLVASDKVDNLLNDGTTVTLTAPLLEEIGATAGVHE